jgi:RNA polymerase sigma factor (sigma-70 family)
MTKTGGWAAQAVERGTLPPSVLQTGSNELDTVDLTTALYRRCRLTAFRMALMMGADWATAEESVQDAFLVVHHRWNALADLDNAPAYLYAVVRNNVTRTMIRSRRRETPMPHEWLASLPWGSDPGPSERLPAAGSAAYQALRSLSPSQQAVLALTADGYRPSEIGEILGMRDLTVRVHLHEARKRARANLATQARQADDVA